MSRTHKIRAKYFIHKDKELPKDISYYDDIGIYWGYRHGNNRKVYRDMKVMARRQDKARKKVELIKELKEPHD